MPDQSLYELLQVSENADQEIIQAAYRRLVLRYHPDRSSEPNAAEMTQRLNDAYAILSDPVQRAEYDRERRGSTGRPSSGTGRSRPNPHLRRHPDPHHLGHHVLGQQQAGMVLSAETRNGGCLRWLVLLR